MTLIAAMTSAALVITNILWYQKCSDLKNKKSSGDDTEEHF